MNTGSKIMIVVITIAVALSSLTIPSLALTYTNSNNAVCVKFTVPEGWIQQGLKDDRDILKVRYTYSGETGEAILFGFCDLRPNQYISPRDQISEIGGADADTIEIVNYYGIDYYKIETTEQAADTSRSSTDFIKLFCVIDGIMFTFQYGSAKDDFSHFTDFEKMLNHVVYTIPSDSNALLIYKLKQENLDPFFNQLLNLVITIMLYLLLIIMLRYSLNKKKCLY